MNAGASIGSVQALLDASNVKLGPGDFEAIVALMQREARIHIPDTKQALVHSRLCKRLRHHGLRSYADYVSLVQGDAVERAVMVEALTTNHTHFFREVHHFDHFRAEVLPSLRQKAASGKPVRIWSAGCSTGEEVYTIAMCLLGQDKADTLWARQGNIRLLATDIAPKVVESVRRATYTSATVEPVPVAYRNTWMHRQGDDYVMNDDVRALVQANVLNLFGQWPMRHDYDVIFCRNVMIYFDDKAKAELEERFVDLLVPGGYLYIGHSERLIGNAAGRMKRAGQTVFVKEGGSS